MLFYSPLFLFIFLPLALATYTIARPAWRGLTLLLWSGLFYAWGEPKFFGIALISAGLDFWICRQMFRQSHPSSAKVYLTLGIALNLLLLAYFKYYNFFLESLSGFLVTLGSAPFAFPKIALPIGVSFIVFEKITYLVDVYRGVGKPATSLAQYWLYVFLFPKLLAGPIVKYHDVELQLNRPEQSSEVFFQGICRFILGLAKKILLADTLSEVADTVFAMPLDQLGFYSAWLGAICFSLQIYLDFSAYSDMAIGLGRMFGFRLMENFNSPYIAANFTEFWRRWHISLSTWIREYLYIPLGGNRQGAIRTYLNLWLCFLASGLWHGASWTFVIWGAYHGLFLALDKLFWLRWTAKWPRLLNVALTVIFVMVGWLIFRANSLAQVSCFLQVMLMPNVAGFPLPVTTYQDIAIAAGLLISFAPLLPIYQTVLRRWRNRPLHLVWEHSFLMLVGVLAIAKAVTTTFSPFLYFRF
jgi:alginate O-acetyltransferase complex protein AlgI